MVPRDRLVEGQGFRGSRLSGCWCIFYKMTSAQEERNHRVTMKGQLEGRGMLECPHQHWHRPDPAV